MRTGTASFPSASHSSRDGIDSYADSIVTTVSVDTSARTAVAQVAPSASVATRTMAARASVMDQWMASEDERLPGREL